MRIQLRKKLKKIIQINLFFILFFSVSIVNGQAVINPADSQDDVEIGVVEHLGDYLPDSIQLINEQGKKVWLKDLIDKPTVLNFVYFRCPGICSPLMEAVAGVMNKSDLVPGKDYQVLTISFDPTETIDLGLRKKENYLNLMTDSTKVEEAKTGWKFFTSDSASIARATNATGFKYKKAGNDFLHAASLSVISPEGEITRYINGLYFLPFEWKMSIIEAAKGQPGPTFNKVLRYCFSYDPKGHTYVVNVTKISGTLILFFGLLFLLVLVFKKKRKII